MLKHECGTFSTSRRVAGPVQKWERLLLINNWLHATLEGVCKVVSDRLRRALSKKALSCVKSPLKRNKEDFTHTLLYQVAVRRRTWVSA
jgi:hypothetical protein